MPIFAPLMKVSSCKSYGANVIQIGQNIQECKDYGFKYAREHGMTYINGFDHPDVLAGQGTIGLEILEEIKNVDAVIVPVSFVLIARMLRNFFTLNNLYFSRSVVVG